MTFESLGLSADLLQTVLEEGYTEPTPVQAKAIPLVLAAVNRTRILPALSAPSVPVGRAAMRRLTAFVGLEAVLALVLLVRPSGLAGKWSVAH